MKKYSTILSSRNESLLIQWLLRKEFEDLSLDEIAKKLESYDDVDSRFYKQLLRMAFGDTSRRYLVLTVEDYKLGDDCEK